jgi:transmembrane sensor
MDNRRLTALFHTYVNETCTEDERLEFMKIVSEADHDEDVRALLDNLWQTLPDQSEIRLSSQKSGEIINSIFISERKEQVTRSGQPNSAWLKIAATISAIMISSLGLYYFTSEKPEATAITMDSAVRENDHQWLRLPDGSTVVLNSGSTLHYPQTFAGNTREVMLIGEGYFDIKHDPDKPFVVRTGTVTTVVLGTAFNIKAYSYEKDITVTVTRGKVKVSDENKLLAIITPDQQLTFRKEKQETRQQVVDSNVVIAWMDQDLFFDDVSMEEAAATLEERFDVEINFNSEKLKACRFTATFVKGEDLQQILEIICEFNRATFEQKTFNRIEIRGEGC